jgi:PelA/Pel-15E family pectate lyase
VHHPIPRFAQALTVSILTVSTLAAAEPSKDEILSAMKKATAFMLDEVSYKGGFLALYSEDLTEQWGEVPATRTMAWVQKPGTVGVGEMFLEAYQKTGDEYFLKCAERTANALVYGQHPSGGWHYFFNFDPAGIETWYEEVGGHCWGWEEFYHYPGNCTFDDDVTAGATGFLLDLYMTSLDPKYREPLLKALGFILESQYPKGGWPQRYPLHYDHPNENGGPDYTSFYTYNDNVTIGNIHLLLRAHAELGNEQYKEAALRGMDFVVISQLGAPQAGWAQQYDMEMKPGGARTYEPAGVAPSTTAYLIRQLMTFYKITGDRKYLRGIPDALDWLDREKLPPGHSDEGHTHAQFVEVGTGKPLYAHREGTSREEGRYWVDYEPGNFPGHYGMQMKLDVDAIRKEYERVFALTPAEAIAEYEAEKTSEPASPEVDPETVKNLLESMNEKGAWIEDLSVPDYTDWKFKPREELRGISTRTYVNNMRTLMNALE